MQIARKRNLSCKVQSVKTKVSLEYCFRFAHPEEFNQRILLALESRASTQHPPSTLRENSRIISGTSRSSYFALCFISSRVSCLVYCVSSHALSRVSSFVSKSCESPKIVDNSDAMVAKIGMKINAEIAHNRFQGSPSGQTKFI